MRCFIPIELPEECKEELVKAQQKLKGGKLTLTKEFHLTLKFLGEITPQQADRTSSILRRIEFNSINCKLNNIGFFPNTKQPRVAWIGIEPEKELEELQKKIDESLEKEFPKEKSFRAHATLARIKFVENKKELLDSINSIKVEKIKFQISEFKLKKSTLTPQGPVYEDVEVFKSQSL